MQCSKQNHDGFGIPYMSDNFLIFSVMFFFLLAASVISFFNPCMGGSNNPHLNILPPYHIMTHLIVPNQKLHLHAGHSTKTSNIPYMDAFPSPLTGFSTLFASHIHCFLTIPLLMGKNFQRSLHLSKFRLTTKQKSFTTLISGI